MTQAGGPAAINGFLYQILHHLGWLADVGLTGKLDGESISEALLVLEPRKGGDARAEAHGVYLVEQYKTRKGRTWSVSDMESVLKDLRKAVPSLLPEHARYRFVTDGRQGLWKAFNEFLAAVCEASSFDDLDKHKKKRFRKGVELTNRAFFDHIVEATRSQASVKSKSERAAVLHLLSKLEFEFDSDADTRAADVEKLLRPHVSDLGKEGEIRDLLVGRLFEILSKGEARLDSAGMNDVFKKAGLSPNRVRKATELATILGEQNRRILKNLNYDSKFDVRSAPDWPVDKPVMLIEGESGSGKTWQMGRLLELYAENRTNVILMQATTNAETTLTRASDAVWQTALGETTEKSLTALSNFLRELLPGSPSSLLIIAIDDVQGIEQARDIVHQDWAALGMRLVMTVPRHVARSLEASDGGAIHVHPAGNFSIDELDSLLKLHDRRWANLPSDLQKLLRQPVLAGLYLQVPEFTRSPSCEYEIFECFWKLIAAKGDRGDAGIVTTLARHMTEGKSYPLSRPEWNKIGLNIESLARLEAAGWLRCSDGGDITFAHDRLLNWAAAKFLAEDFRNNHITIEKIGSFLIAKRNEKGERMRRRLGYVPMDILWMLSGNSKFVKALGRLVGQLEESGEFGSYGENLYTQLLPTLGQRAVSILIERMRELATDDYRVQLIGRTFTTLVSQEDVDLTAAFDALLKESNREHQNVALAALTIAPDSKRLNCLWELHCDRFKDLGDAGNEAYQDYRISFRALRATIERKPEWLRKRICEADVDDEPVSELGHLLDGLDYLKARKIWDEFGDTLMEKVSSEKSRCLLNCIGRFTDRGRINFVIENLSRREDGADGAAIAALVVLDPEIAIKQITSIDESTLYLYRNSWLPLLLRVEPDLARRTIFNISDTTTNGRRFVEMLFSNWPDAIDEALLGVALRGLEHDLRMHFEKAEGTDSSWLFHPLSFLSGLADPKLLEVLQAEAGGELERMIVNAACERLGSNSSSNDVILQHAHSVLILMGGEGITTLICRELESEHYWIRHRGLNWAFARADDEIIQRLTLIARRPIPRDANGKLESYPYSEFHSAMTGLAALGADEALVETILHGGISELPLDIAWLRIHRGTMPKTTTQCAVQTLGDASISEENLLAALSVIWLSKDPNLIPMVHAVLARVDDESLVAMYACLALMSLGDRSEAFAEFAQRLVQSKANVRHGVNALISLGDRGMELASDWLNGRSPSERNDLDDHVVRILHRNASTSAASIGVAVERVLNSSSFLYDLFDIAAEANEPILRERILERAFTPDSIVVDHPLRAIKGLAKFDEPRAIEAIELAFETYPKIEGSLCRLLVRLDPEGAAGKLFEAVMRTERASLRRAAGRALRRLNQDVASCFIVEHMEGAASERKIAAELAGWLLIPGVADKLGELADTDPERDVRQAALEALKRHRHEEIVRTLIAEFPGSTFERRWSTLLAILGVGDPFLLSDKEDPLWLGKAIDETMPGIFAKHAESFLKKRRKEESK